MYLVIPWLTHGYALHLKINTSGSFCHFSPVSAISPQQKGFSPQFLPMAGEIFFSAWEKANPDYMIYKLTL